MKEGRQEETAILFGDRKEDVVEKKVEEVVVGGRGKKQGGGAVAGEYEGSDLPLVSPNH